MENFDCPGDKQKININPTYHDMPHQPGTENIDPLKQALHTAECKSESVNTQSDRLSPQSVNGSTAQDRLAQEAWFADPGRMAREFPRILRDVNHSFGNDKNDISGHAATLTKGDITRALKYSDLPQDEKNYLQVLDDNYKLFNQDVEALADPQYAPRKWDHGIDQTDIFLVAKAVDRNGIKADPINEQLNEKSRNLAIAGALGGLVGTRIASSKDELGLGWYFGAAAVGAVAAYGESKYRQHALKDHTQASYDGIKDQYLLIKDAYSKPATSNK